MSFGTAVLAADPPKSGTLTFSETYHATLHLVAMRQGLTHYSYNAIGGMSAAIEGTFPDRMSRLGDGRILKGKTEAETGLCEFLDLSGDQVFVTETSKTKSTSNTFTANHSIVGGTGKYTTIVGDSSTFEDRSDPRLRDRVSLRGKPQIS